MSEWKSHNAREKAIARIVHLEAENDDLKKDKERLAWLLARLYENTTPELRAIYRDDFDEAMNPSPSIFDEMSDKQRQQICHEHGQPTQ